MWDAFDNRKRQLEDVVRRRCGQVKSQAGLLPTAREPPAELSPD
jgi:hypothetical protein